MALLLLSVLGCQPGGIGADWHRVQPPRPAPSFTLKTLDGQSVSLDGQRGRVIVLDFWATWCPPCRAAMPSLDLIHRRFQARGVSVLLVNEGESADVIRQWIGRRVTAPILLDEDQAVAVRYGVESLPRLFVLDRAGRVVYQHAGYGGGLERNLSLILEQLLSGPG